MSGPKTDAATIERQRQEALERERQERIRQIRLYNESLTSIEFQLANFTSLCTKLIRGITDENEMKFACLDVEEIKQNCNLEIAGILTNRIPTTSVDIIALNENVCQQAYKIFSVHTDRLSSSKARIEEYTKNKKEIINGKLFSQSIEALSASGPSTVFSDVDFTSFADVLDSAPEVKQDIALMVRQAVADLETLANNKSILRKDRTTVLDFARSILETVKSSGSEKRLSNLIDQFNFCKDGICRRINSFEDKYQDYFAELSEANLSESVAGGTDEIMLRQRSDFADEQAIVEETRKVKAKAISDMQRRYIQQQIDQVMAKLGYVLSDTIVLREKIRGQNILYSGEGKEAAIHVYISEANQVMMEVVGIGETEIASEEDLNFNFDCQKSGDLTSSERDKLYQEQVAFCSMHPRIVAELEACGVCFNKVKRKLPGLENCKKMVRVIKTQNKVRAEDFKYRQKNVQKSREMK